MNIEELCSRLGDEVLKELAQAENIGVLMQMAIKRHNPLSVVEAHALFEALTPLRGKQCIDDADLLEVCGGEGGNIKPPKSFIPPKKSPIL